MPWHALSVHASKRAARYFTHADCHACFSSPTGYNVRVDGHIVSCQFQLSQPPSLQAQLLSQSLPLAAFSCHQAGFSSSPPARIADQDCKRTRAGSCMHACVNKDTGHWAPPEGPHEPHQSSDSSAWVSGSSGVMGTLSPFGRPCGWWPALTSAAQNTHTWQQTRCTHCMHIGHARITPTRAIPNAVHACAHAKHIAGGAPGDFAAVATMAFTGAATNMHLYV